MKFWEVILCFLIVMDFTYCKLYGVPSTSKYYKMKPNQHYTKPKEYVIDLKVHFDGPLARTLVKKHNVRPHKIKKYVATKLVSQVEDYFRHPSLNQKIKINLLDTRLMRNSTMLDENVSNYLRNYCAWQEKKKNQKNELYYSVLLTGLNVYYLDKKGSEIRKSTARSYMRSMCTANKSCSILEWHNPSNNAYLLAHEIAHGLGVHHDGPPYNECKIHKNVMSDQYNPMMLPKVWSTCSKRKLEKLLRSDSLWCLKQKKVKGKIFSGVCFFKFKQPTMAQKVSTSAVIVSLISMLKEFI